MPKPSEQAAFGIYPQAGKRGQRKPTAREQLAQIFSDDRAMEMPQFGEVDLGVPTAANRAMGQRMVERDVDLKRQSDRDMSPLEKIAGGMQTGRLIGSGLTQAVKSIPTAITKGGKAAEDYIAENIYKPTQPKAYEYAGDIGDFMSRLETDYKIPPILPEAIALQNVIGPAARQGARNLSAPRTLDPQAGAIVYHGSPHKFDKFSSKKIGTGEGAQAYGHGLYFAESPEVAKTYQPRSPKYEQKLIDLYQKASSTSNYPMMEVLEDAMLHQSPSEIIKKFTNADDGYTGQHAKAAQDFVKWYSKNEPEVGGLYTVDLPDEKIAQMLDYDKPLSAQSPEVKRVLMEHPDVLDYIAKAEAQRAKLNEMSPVRLEKIPSASVPYDESRMAGKDVMTAIAQRSGLGKAQGAIEEELRQLGIPGIRYLDEQSRGSKGADGSSNFVVFPGEEDALTIVDRKANGGRVHFSDNPDVMQLELAGGGLVGKLAKAAKEAAVPLSVPRVRPTTKDILEAAERVGKQQAGEFVRSPLTTKTSNLAGRSKKEVDRLKELEYKVTPIKDLPEMKPYEAKIGEVNIALPGDQTISDMLLESVDGIPIGTTSEGGALFGRGRLSDPEETRAFWASNIGPADLFQKKVTELAQLYDTDMVTAYHLAMGQMSNNFAQHMADASMRAIDYSKLNKDKMNAFDKVVSQGYVDPTTKERVTFENWPGIADPEGSLQAMKEDPKLRKWFNNRMKTEKVTKPLDLPNAKSIEWAMTEPELRNMEINLTGLSAGRMKPGAELIPDSAHQTYSHDIPGTALGRAPELSPFSISFPDVTAFVREKYRPQDFTGTIQKVFPHQVVDEAYLEDMYKYYTQLRKVRGFNEGGSVRKSAGGEITADDLILEERKL